MRCASIVLISVASIVVAGCNHPTGTRERANAPGDATPRHPGVVILVRKPDHVLAALHTIGDLRRQAPTPSQYRVLVCGPGLQALTKDSSVAPQIRSSLERDVIIEACGMAMKKQGLKPDALLAGITVVPNALAESVTLQLQGWVSVEL